MSRSKARASTTNLPSRPSDATAFGISYDFQNTGVGDFAGFNDTQVNTHALSLSINYYVQ